MRILGIDPGYGRLGIAVIDAEKGKKEILIYSECLETDKKLPQSERLRLVGEKIKETIKKYSPEIAGIEGLLFSKNKKTAIGVAEARGVILECLSSAKIPIKEYNPGSIKIAVTRSGSSDKDQMRKMIEIIIGKKFTNAMDDECDAIAVALTLAATERM
jgi:crossover junction endodeoxyribonuclease RuvC